MTYIVAELGINHNGSLKIAKDMMKAAAKAGADAVKFQAYKTEQIIGVKDPALIAILKQCEFTREQFNELKAECPVGFIVSVFDVDSVKTIQGIADTMKLPSGHLTNTKLIQATSGKCKELILSTGMSTFWEIEQALSIIKFNCQGKVALLHCVSGYPTSVEECNLNIIKKMMLMFNLPVGWSDHTLYPEIAVAAVMNGAWMVEKHFTLDKNMDGPDHKISFNPEEFGDMVRMVRNAEKALGNSVKKIQESEKKTLCRKFA